MRANLKFLYLMEVFSGLSRGSYLVCMGWVTLIVSDDVAKVGQIFIVAMLTNILSGPLTGTIVDRYNRKYLVMVAHFCMTLTMGTLAAAWMITADPQLSWLFIAVIVVSALRLLHNAAHDGLIQASVAMSDTVHTVARCRAIHLIATAIGTVAAGSAIERISPSSGFLFSALASLLLLLPMIFVAGIRHKENAPGFAGFVADIVGGLKVFQVNRHVRLVTILTALCLPIGQLSNAILSSFIRDDLGEGSEAFGIVDAAWPMGGMLAAFVLSLGIRNLSRNNMEYLFAVLAGLSTIGLSLCTTIPLLIILHGAMGSAIWLCRIVIDGRILQECTQENIGRTRVYVDMVFSLSAIIMCFSPTFIQLPSTAAYFMLWGGLMIVGSLCLWLSKN